MALGINRRKVAILAALSTLGGSAQTSALVAESGITTQALLYNLRELEAPGYVSGDIAPSQRRPGVRITWTIHPETLNADLRALMAIWSPNSE